MSKNIWKDASKTSDALYLIRDQQRVQCFACAHKCIINAGEYGICGIRRNDNGKLLIPWGYVSTINSESIEKKPLFHFLPGAKTLSFGMLGCSFHCNFCQNWPISQGFDKTTYEPFMKPSLIPISSRKIIDKANEMGCSVIASTYNEPFISLEWAVEIFKLAQVSGIKPILISNGYASQEAFQDISPFLAGCKVDLKSMRGTTYKDLGGRLKEVMDFIESIYNSRIWLEVVTLVIPGINDNTEEFREIARFIISLSPQIPWHVNTFYPHYLMKNLAKTPYHILEKAVEIGYTEGLKYVYTDGTAKEFENYHHTYCPMCHTCLITRYRQMCTEVILDSYGKCPKCGYIIAGIWNQKLG
jgi:pyruvate formate lyase activating enzyme